MQMHTGRPLSHFPRLGDILLTPDGLGRYLGLATPVGVLTNGNRSRYIWLGLNQPCYVDGPHTLEVPIESGQVRGYALDRLQEPAAAREEVSTVSIVTVTSTFGLSRQFQGEGPNHEADACAKAAQFLVDEYAARKAPDQPSRVIHEE